MALLQAVKLKLSKSLKVPFLDSVLYLFFQMSQLCFIQYRNFNNRFVLTVSIATEIFSPCKFMTSKTSVQTEK